MLDCVTVLYINIGLAAFALFLIFMTLPRCMGIFASKEVKEILHHSPDKETREVLRMMDRLLEKLPESEIRKFSKSREFSKYKKVMERAK